MTYPTMPQGFQPPRLRPSLAWLILVVVLFLGGVGGCSALSYSGVHRMIHAQRLDQSGVMSLDAGKYTVYSTGPKVTITSPAGQSVPLSHYDGTTHLTFQSTRYRAISTFTAETGGSYRVLLAGAGSVAVGPGLTANSVRIGVGIALGFVGVVAAVGLLIVVLVRRGRHKRRLSGGDFGGYRQPGGYGYVVPNAAGGYPNQGYPPAGQGYPPPNQGYPPANQGYPPANQSYPPPGPPPSQPHSQ